MIAQYTDLIQYINFHKIPALELLRLFWVGGACCCLVAILANRKQCSLHAKFLANVYWTAVLSNSLQTIAVSYLRQS